MKELVDKLKIVCICLVALVCAGCGEKDVVNYSANALTEFKAGRLAAEVFQEDTVSSLLQNRNDVEKKIIDYYISCIEVTGVTTDENYAYYICSIKDVSAVASNIINSEAFKTEIDKRKISGDFSDFKTFIQTLILQDMQTCPTVNVTVTGYLGQNKLLTSKDLFAPLATLLNTEIPEEYTVNAEETGEELPIVNGDFVTKVDKCRILISNITVLEGQDAIEAIQSLDSRNTGKGVYISFDATNLSKTEAIVESRFYGVSDDFRSVESDAAIIGLHDTVKLQSGEEAHMDAYAQVTSNGLLVWKAEDSGSYFYQWKEEEEVNE